MHLTDCVYVYTTLLFEWVKYCMQICISLHIMVWKQLGPNMVHIVARCEYIKIEKWLDQNSNDIKMADKKLQDKFLVIVFRLS